MSKFLYDIESDDNDTRGYDKTFIILNAPTSKDVHLSAQT